MLAFSSWARFHELDMRWEIVLKVVNIAKLLFFVFEDSSVIPTFNLRAPLRLVNHQFGLHEDILTIPNHVKIINVYSIVLEGNHYVCGIGFSTGKTTTLSFGNKTESYHKIDISNMITETIGFAVDALGIRSIKYGVSPWSFGDPKTIGCWEGFSVRQGHREIRIIHDALKLRHISWHSECPPSFEETLLVKNKHPSLSGHGFIAKKHYLQQHPEQEIELVNKFGNFPVEAMWFNQDLQIIKIYAGGGLDGISGLSIQTLSETCCVGTCDIVPTSLTLHAPHEVLTEIDVRISELYPLAIIFRTSYNRELPSEPPEKLLQPGIYSTTKTLRPPSGYRITGLYFRLAGGNIDSIGIIFGSRTCEYNLKEM